MGFKHAIARWLGVYDNRANFNAAYQAMSNDRYMEGFKDGTEKCFGVTLPQMTYLRRFWEMNDMPWPPSMQSLMRWQTKKERGMVDAE